MKSGNGMAGTGTSPWRCWPTPAWRWSGARRWNKEVREKRGLSQLGRKADTPDGARGPAVALPADMETSTYGRISAAVVPVETAAPGNGPALPLPTPPETPHHISATVVLVERLRQVPVYCLIERSDCTLDRGTTQPATNDISTYSKPLPTGVAAARTAL